MKALRSGSSTSSIPARLAIAGAALLLGLFVSYLSLAGELGLARAIAARVYSAGHLLGWIAVLTTVLLAAIGYRRSALQGLAGCAAIAIGLLSFAVAIEPRLEARARLVAQQTMQRLLADTAMVTLRCEDGFMMHLSQ